MQHFSLAATWEMESKFPPFKWKARLFMVHLAPGRKMWTILCRALGKGRFSALLPPIKSCCKMKFLPGPGQSRWSYGRKSLRHKPRSRKNNGKYLKATSLVLGSVLRRRILEAFPTVSSEKATLQRPLQGGGGGWKTKRHQEAWISIAQWLINISTKLASPLFSLLECLLQSMLERS